MPESTLKRVSVVALPNAALMVQHPGSDGVKAPLAAAHAGVDEGAISTEVWPPKVAGGAPLGPMKVT